MKQRHGTMPLQVIVVFVILISVLILVTYSVFYPDSGLLWKAGRTVGDLSNNVPVQDKDIRLKELPFDKNIKNSWDSIITALQASKTANAPCIMNYNKRDLEGYLFELKKEGSNTKVLLRKPVGAGAQEYSESVEGVSVCVVAGKIQGNSITVKKEATGKDVVINIDKKSGADTDNPFAGIDSDFEEFRQSFPDYTDKEQLRFAAQNFYTNWIGDFGEKLNYASMRRAGEKIVSNDYTNVKSILIPSSDKIVIGYDTSSIETDKEDGGLLYVPEKGKVCFLATVETKMPGCNDGGYVNGLEQDCIDDEEEINKLKSHIC